MKRVIHYMKFGFKPGKGTVDAVCVVMQNCGCRKTSGNKGKTLIT